MPFTPTETEKQDETRIDAVELLNRIEKAVRVVRQQVVSAGLDRAAARK